MVSNERRHARFPASPSHMTATFDSILHGLLYASAICGASPFKKVDERSYAFSWKLMAYCALLCALSMLEGIYWIYISLKSSSLTVTLLLDFFSFHGSIISWFALLFQCFSNRHELPAIMSEFYRIHDRAGRATYGSQYVAGTIAMSILNLVPKVYLMATMPLELYVIIFIVLYYVYSNMPLVVAGQYASVMGLLSDQLSFVSGRFRACRTDRELQECAGVHQSACLLARRLNRSYDLFLILAVTFSFVVVVIQPYKIIAFIVKLGLGDVDRLVGSALDFLLHVCRIAIIIKASMKATNSAKEFNYQLFEILLDNKTLDEQHRLRTYLSMDYGIKQRAFDIFPLNYSLITSMIAAMATYVILLVQLTLLK